MTLTIQTITEPAMLTTLADWFAARLLDEPDYISHSEILWGRALGPDQWRPDLAAVLRAEFLAPDPDVRRLAAMDGPDIAGLACTRLQREGGHAALILEDMMVDPARRRAGVARALLKAAEAVAAESGAPWIALESGARNEAAHAFFEKMGYAVVSKTMVKGAG